MNSTEQFLQTRSVSPMTKRVVYNQDLWIPCKNILSAELETQYERGRSKLRLRTVAKKSLIQSANIGGNFKMKSLWEQNWDEQILRVSSFAQLAIASLLLFAPLITKFFDGTTTSALLHAFPNSNGWFGRGREEGKRLQRHHMLRWGLKLERLSRGREVNQRCWRIEMVKEGPQPENLRQSRKLGFWRISSSVGYLINKLIPCSPTFITLS